MRGYVRRTGWAAALAAVGLLLAGASGPAATAAPAAAQGQGRNGDPVATSWGANRLDVFEIDHHNPTSTVRQRTFNGSWQPWRALPGRFTAGVGVTISALSSRVGRIDLFLVGRRAEGESDKTLFHNRFEGGRWSDWQSLGSGFTDYAPEVLAPSPDTLELVSRIPGGNVAHRKYIEGSGWGPWADLGFRSWGGPTSTTRGAATGVDIFNGDSEIGLYHGYWQSAGWRFDRLVPAGKSASIAGATPLPGQNRMLLFHWNHNDNSLQFSVFHDYWRGTYPYSTSDRLTWGSRVSSTAWTDRTDLFTKGRDGTVHHGGYANNTWQDWVSLGGPQVGSSIAAVSWAQGRIDLFVRDSGSRLHHRAYDGGRWLGWEQL